ncbi:thioredoxin family protein [Allomuricauda sp. d1]|uniref:TlpA family protein disulfide reductase n=1 Tax=Allomuricauda sp. d1 TaxID=3136725 RepID=UPI0031DDDA23
MKILISAFLLICLLPAHAQFNKEITLDDGRKFLVGQLTLDGLKSESYSSWFEQNYKKYVVDDALISMFKEQLSDHHIKLFLGTWCGDSKREVPRFIKILHAAEYPMENLEIVALDRRKEFYKTSPTSEEQGLNIVKVPTMIFFNDGKEMNRIIERPVESLEEDIAAILMQKSYTPNYAHLKRTE